MTNKLRILVIDDKPENLQDAINQIGEEYEITTASSYEEARELLSPKIFIEPKGWQPNPQKFDILLTDLFMPVVEKHVENQKDKNKEHPYGLIFIFMAIASGIKMIGVVSSENHHHNAFLYAVEPITKNKQYGEIILVGSYADGPGYKTYDEVSGKTTYFCTKSWKTALRELILQRDKNSAKGQG